MSGLFIKYDTIPKDITLSCRSKKGVHRFYVPIEIQLSTKEVDLPCRSPHKFRHGHAVCALKNAKDVSALKAVSQNLMHANLSITDGVYGILSEGDIKAQINKLGTLNLGDESNNTERLIYITKELTRKIEKSRKMH